MLIRSEHTYISAMFFFPIFCDFFFQIGKSIHKTSTKYQNDRLALAIETNSKVKDWIKNGVRVTQASIDVWHVKFVHNSFFLEKKNYLFILTFMRVRS